MKLNENSLREATADNGSFSSQIPGLQIAWDSTSLGLLKECPKKYFYTMILGYVRGTNVHLDFGLYLHSALEFFDKAKATGISYEDALDATVTEVLKMTGTNIPTWTCGEHNHFSDNLETCPTCGKPVELIEGEFGFLPWSSNDSYKNRFTLLRTVIWYLDHFKNDVVETIILSNGKPAVELSFKMEIPLPSPEGEAYLLCGHIDRLVDFNGAPWVMDRKTTKSALDNRYFSNYSPDNQMSLYALASNVILNVPSKGVIIDGIQVAVNFSRFARGFANRTQAQLEEWLADTMTVIRQAETYADAQHWPMNDKSCDKYGGCPFREICAKDPRTREPFLKSNFTRRVWNPLEAR